ncbi:MAG: heme NO-binding domain-containing protein [Nostoc sp. DedVER02]|uniref:heme NO-binding domain-containing protein n=1 Tax=unclassified Nostoc TaxID=2593658 RepID=UPI002AD4C257|nr:MULTISPECIES: heme NO-binding domain-containing protein [unclassified Nostoc]MDZ7988834.1 heme NO-binding domain-containing protein [Nostoc sp. DedVER02]MDZ8116373.1 heme NO-binding domain-containing protein [Nostoc sp. DedVER01b]
MYGLINKAIQDMVCDRFGEETWQTIKQKAEVQIDDFLRMESYPDDLTHKLVKATSEVVGLSSVEIMQAFGEYWIQYTGKAGYGLMLDMGGDNLPEFLDKLDDLHTRLSVNFPQYRPPSFECAEEEENTLELHYHSSRQGLAPMVVGLVKGLGTRFNTEVNITQTQNREEGAEHDVFFIEYKPN